MLDSAVGRIQEKSAVVTSTFFRNINTKTTREMRSKNGTMVKLRLTTMIRITINVDPDRVAQAPRPPPQASADNFAHWITISSFLSWCRFGLSGFFFDVLFAKKKKNIPEVRKL